jgi:hypothetical protein
MMQVPAMPLERFRQTAAHADEAGMDWAGLVRSIARRGPGLSNLCHLLVGRHALPEHPVHGTLGGAASASERPKAR